MGGDVGRPQPVVLVDGEAMRHDEGRRVGQRAEQVARLVSVRVITLGVGLGLA